MSEFKVAGKSPAELLKFYSNVVGVHITHCCVRHGCQYGVVGCPVRTRLVDQEYPCEECKVDDDGNLLVEVELKAATAGYLLSYMHEAVQIEMQDPILEEVVVALEKALSND